MARGPSTTRPRIKTPNAVKTQRKAERAVINQQIETAIQEKMQYLSNGIDELSAKFKHVKSRSYFETRFHLGSKMLCNQRNHSAWQACLSIMAEELKSGDTPASLKTVTKAAQELLAQLHEDNPPAELVERVAERQKKMKGDRKVPRPTRRGVQTDANRTLNSVSEELSHLNARTGVEYFLGACRENPTDFVDPVFASSEKAGKFVMHASGLEGTALTNQMEAFTALKDNGRARVQRKKDADKMEARKEIQLALNTFLGKTVPMQYKRFDSLIREKYGVDIKGWPDAAGSIEDFGSNIGSGKIKAALQAWTAKDKEKRAHFVWVKDLESDKNEPASEDSLAPAAAAQSDKNASSESPGSAADHTTSSVDDARGVNDLGGETGASTSATDAPLRPLPIIQELASLPISNASIAVPESNIPIRFSDLDISKFPFTLSQ
ncbi:hypothetical protein BOTBODRAFT_178098 [Botryobasidium botryosum FD-172 SS1]|uniref:Uncharacterized protein n=1 Tax=Botryobasidium botryosum (strain FD-172 SS1) TaxID=930990 RepID=A0A067M4Y2_BOTB1|nr:hypothetical protein BOTBODRAFT_178098 [Botryobasidium botryosum FD-172 SS1]